MYTWYILMYRMIYDAKPKAPADSLVAGNVVTGTRVVTGIETRLRFRLVFAVIFVLIHGKRIASI